MKIPAWMFRFLNPVVAALLRSPLHALMSGDVMLITVTGRRTGRRFTIPVSYTRDGGTVRCFTERQTKWWRNLRGGADVTLRVAGEDRNGRAQAIGDDPERISQALGAFLTRLPRDAVYYDVRLESDQRPDPDDVTRAGKSVILVEVQLETERQASR